jgi:hypothetical protein
VLPAAEPDFDFPAPNFSEPEFESRPANRGLKIVLILIALAILGCTLSLLLSKQGGNPQSLASLAQNAAQTKPIMLSSLPAASYTSKTIDYANWEINVDPSVEASNDSISIKMTLKNWNGTSQTFSYKANDIILYDDVGNKYPISMDGCADDAGFLQQQFSFDAYESTDLSSSSYWCSNQGTLPGFTGIIPGNAKHHYLQLTNFGVFPKITFVYNL